MVALLEKFDLPTALPAGFHHGPSCESLARDKKFEAGQMRFVLTPKLGEAFLSGRAVRRGDLAAVEGLCRPRETAGSFSPLRS